MAAESFPPGRRSQAERPRNGAPNQRSVLVGVGNSERRPAISRQCLALFPRRTGDGGSDPARGKRGAKPRIKAALPLPTRSGRGSQSTLAPYPSARAEAQAMSSPIEPSRGEVSKTVSVRLSGKGKPEAAASGKTASRRQ